MFRLRSSLAVSALALTLASCANVQDLRSTTRQDPNIPETPQAWAMARERVGEVEVGWITSFNDPVLETLVREAQENNRNLQAAAANVDRARALARQAGASLQPSVDLNVGGSQGGNIESSSDGDLSAGLELNWEADVWGRIRSGQQAAAASAESAEADYLFTQYSIAAQVALAYFVAIEASIQERIAKESEDNLTETARITQVQYEAGLASAQDLALVRSDLASASDSLVEAQGSKRESLRALEVLLGRYPSTDLEVRTALPAVPPPPPAGLPSEILERRPDLIAAEREVAAAFNELKQAKAARLPTVSLTTEIGGSSGQLSNLLDPANVAWTLAGNIAAPIFDGGQRQAEVEIQDAEQRQAIANYVQTAIEAFQEVEDSLDSGSVLAQREVFLTESAREAQEAYRIAELRYREGETDLIDVLDIQTRVFEAESNLANVQRQLISQRVDLNLALGGNWDDV
ncbi:MAG: efflux transporter outer membrane subunit [Pseudomonadota bacterium]